jgi:RNA polymerase sigma factor (sigma-70 family)
MGRFSLLQHEIADNWERTGKLAGVPVAELVHRCVDHDADAWHEVLHRYRGLVWSVPLRLGLTKDDAAEVFQDVFESLLRNLPSLQEPRRLASWLYTAARRLSLRRVSVLRRRAPRDEQAAIAAQNPESAGRSVTEELVELERRREVLRLVESLPERCRRLLTALFLDPDEPEYDDIAETLGLPRGSIGPSRIRCLKRLYELMVQSNYPFGQR